MAANEIDLTPPDTPDDQVLTIYMTSEQYEYLLYCADRVEKNREATKNRYHERKIREGKQPRKKNFPILGTQAYQQYMQQQQQESLGNTKPLQLPLQTPYQQIQSHEILGNKSLQLVINKSC
jgi:hypothetical protein